MKFIRLIIPLLLVPIAFGLEWYGGVIKPSGVNVYYHPGDLSMYPEIKVFPNSIKIGDYLVKIYPFDEDNRVDVYIDSIIGNKIFRIEPDSNGKVYFSICGLERGDYNLYVDDILKDTFNDTTCVSETLYLEGDTEHKIKVEPVVIYGVKPQPQPDYTTYVLIGLAVTLAVILGYLYFKK